MDKISLISGEYVAKEAEEGNPSLRIAYTVLWEFSRQLSNLRVACLSTDNLDSISQFEAAVEEWVQILIFLNGNLYNRLYGVDPAPYFLR